MRSTLPKECGLGQVAVDQKPANFAQELERAKGTNPRHSCRSTIELRPRFAQHSEGPQQAARCKEREIAGSCCKKIFGLGAKNIFIELGAHGKF
jgi:hypothetical protein